MSFTSLDTVAQGNSIKVSRGNRVKDNEDDHESRIQTLEATSSGAYLGSIADHGWGATDPSTIDWTWPSGTKTLEIRPSAQAYTNDYDYNASFIIDVDSTSITGFTCLSGATGDLSGYSYNGETIIPGTTYGFLILTAFDVATRNIQVSINASAYISSGILIVARS